MEKQRTNPGNLRSYVFAPFVLIAINLVQALMNGWLAEKYWLYLLYLPIAGAVLLVERRRQKSGVQLAYRHTYGLFAAGLYGMIAIGVSLWPAPRVPGLIYDVPPSALETVMYACGALLLALLVLLTLFNLLEYASRYRLFKPALSKWVYRVGLVAVVPLLALEVILLFVVAG